MTAKKPPKFPTYDWDKESDVFGWIIREAERLKAQQLRTHHSSLLARHPRVDEPPKS